MPARSGPDARLADCVRCDLVENCEDPAAAGIDSSCVEVHGADPTNLRHVDASLSEIVQAEQQQRLAQPLAAGVRVDAKRAKPVEPVNAVTGESSYAVV